MSAATIINGNKLADSSDVMDAPRARSHCVPTQKVERVSGEGMGCTYRVYRCKQTQQLRDALGISQANAAECGCEISNNVYSWKATKETVKNDTMAAETDRIYREALSSPDNSDGAVYFAWEPQFDVCFGPADCKDQISVRAVSPQFNICDKHRKVLSNRQDLWTKIPANRKIFRH